MEYVPAKTIVTRTKSTAWFGTNYNMNIYRGCCHGCIYCDSRSDCYHIDDFDTVRAKQDALRIIRDDLQRKIRPGVVGTGAMSDPYNPFERTEQLTRHALELIDAFDFGVAIATKSDLICRDIDILLSIQRHSPVLCKLTITTVDDTLAAQLEPHAPSSSARFAAIRQLSDAGLYAGIILMPVLPFLTDTEENVRALVRRAAESGAKFIYPSFGVTLRQNQRMYYYHALDRLFPGLREQYIRRYGDRYQCSSPRARTLFAAFAEECTACGLRYQMRDIIRGYQAGYGGTQLSFFD